MWVAGWNMPGCVPETDPQTFDDWRDAADHLVSELNRWLDSEPATMVPTVSEMQLNNAIRDLEYGDYENDTWRSLSVLGYTFWIERSS